MKKRLPPFLLLPVLLLSACGSSKTADMLTFHSKKGKFKLKKTFIAFLMLSLLLLGACGNSETAGHHDRFQQKIRTATVHLWKRTHKIFCRSRARRRHAGFNPKPSRGSRFAWFNDGGECRTCVNHCAQSVSKLLERIIAIFCRCRPYWGRHFCLQPMRLAAS